jgi:thiol-disulfide isomerase/thioredoxin
MRFKYVFLVLLILLIASCAVEEEEKLSVVEDVAEGGGVSGDPFRNPELEDTKTTPEFNWRNAEFKDIVTGETFTISQFSKPIILESFAVWCPTCTRQQKEIKILHEELGDEVISISLDTDPNEDEATVKAHIERNGFDWYYAISPKEATQSLIDEFGVGVVNAPSVPLIIICNGKATYLGRGVKEVSELKDFISGC